MTKRVGAIGLFCLFAAGSASAAEIQGVLADWSCIKRMVHDGRAKVLKQDGNCSLNPNYSRAAYGLITDDKRFFRLDDAGRAWALRLLKDTAAKDNLRVIISGDLSGNVIHVKNMSEL